jgi:hypothetical protein
MLFFDFLTVLSALVCIAQNSLLASAQDSSVVPSSVPSSVPSMSPTVNPSGSFKVPSSVPSVFPSVGSTTSALSFKALSGLWLVENNPMPDANGTPYYKNASCYRVLFQYLNDDALLYVDQFNVGSASGPLTIGDWGFVLNLSPTGGVQDFNLTWVNEDPYFKVSVNVSQVGPLNSAGLYSWILIQWLDSPYVTNLNSEAALYVREPSYFKNGSHVSELRQIANFNNLSISSLINSSHFEGCNFTQSLWDIEVN